MGTLSIWREVIFNRGLLIIIYVMITIATGIQVILKGSVGIGAAALVGCGTCLIASITTVNRFLTRCERQYSAKDLSIIAAIAVSLTLIGLALMKWSGFGPILHNTHVSGIQWALVGSVVGVIAAKNSGWSDKFDEARTLL